MFSHLDTEDLYQIESDLGQQIVSLSTNSFLRQFQIDQVSMPKISMEYSPSLHWDAF